MSGIQNVFCGVQLFGDRSATADTTERVTCNANTLSYAGREVFALVANNCERVMALRVWSLIVPTIRCLRLVVVATAGDFSGVDPRFGQGSFRKISTVHGRTTKLGSKPLTRACYFVCWCVCFLFTQNTPDGHGSERNHVWAQHPKWIQLRK